MTKIHHEHDMEILPNGRDEECFRCLLCTCHSPSWLRDECVPVIPPFDRHHVVLPPYLSEEDE